MKKTAVPLLAVVVAALAAASVPADPKDPVRGEAFRCLVASQDTAFQDYLRVLFLENDGYVVAGPLDPCWPDKQDFLFDLPRVICANRNLFDGADSVFEDSLVAADRGRIDPVSRPGYSEIHYWMLDFTINGKRKNAVVLSYQHNREVIWEQRVRLEAAGTPWSEKRWSYMQAMRDYVHELDDGDNADGTSGEPPRAADFGLPDSYDLYPPRPDYVIQGYQNYKDYLHEHADIETYFADGILAFVPTDSLLDVLKRDAPEVAWPNKEAPLLQHEFKKFFDRGGDTRVMRTLTAEVLKSLESGEYFYAVGLNGKIRFAREMPREEIDRIEKETGKKVPRANHAFLFPGEPVLTAGAFFVVRDREARIAGVDTHSGHYFYSNVSETIREDVAVRSDEYLLTIGHFFRALDREGIPYDEILIRKM
jgi:hypothetical protein